MRPLHIAAVAPWLGIFVPILYRDPAFDAFDDFIDFVESTSSEPSKSCQVRGSNPCRGATTLLYFETAVDIRIGYPTLMTVHFGCSRARSRRWPTCMSKVNLAAAGQRKFSIMTMSLPRHRSGRIEGPSRPAMIPGCRPARSAERARERSEWPVLKTEGNAVRTFRPRPAARGSTDQLEQEHTHGGRSREVPPRGFHRRLTRAIAATCVGGAC